MINFKVWLESKDIFGFDSIIADEPSQDDMSEKPICAFNIELMMDFLSNKRVGLASKNEGHFVNEMQWGGSESGAVRLEVDTGYTFYIKKLGHDLNGESCWITKRMFQLNRQGYGGQEDAVASEIHEYINTVFEEQIESPKEDYAGLGDLVAHISSKVKRVAKNILVHEGVKKLSDDNYLIIFGVRGHGLEGPDQSRVEENLTQITYDKNSGTIRIMNYNVESPVGGPHKWELMPNDLDLKFFPTQDREEISEAVAVFFKYY